MPLRSMALLLYAASASAGAPSTPAIARGTPCLTGLLRRASSLAPVAALEPVCMVVASHPKANCSEAGSRKAGRAGRRG